MVMIIACCVNPALRQLVIGIVGLYECGTPPPHSSFDISLNQPMLRFSAAVDLITAPFLGEFIKSRKANLSFVMSVRTEQLGFQLT
jgi:hypothetical protein